MPRIKKAATDCLKALHEKFKDDETAFERLLQEAFKKTAESPEEAKSNCTYDEATVAKLMKISKVASKPATDNKAGGKKDFRAFLKQQKTQVPKKDDTEVDVVVKD